MRNKLLVACLIIIISGAVLHLRMGYPVEKLLPVFAAVLGGMFFVDLDVPLYYIRQRLVIVVIVVMMALFGGVYYLYAKRINSICPLSGELLCGVLYFFISLAVASLIAHFFDVITPFKEGPLHGVIPSIAFGLLVLGIYTHYFNFDIGIISGFLAFFASILHLFLDSGKNN
ncbi:MAG: hypothetical protein QXW70_03995 [Candidatus Anstonellales archaeon]